MKNSRLAGISQENIVSSHHYQFDGSHPNRNECTLCSMTTLLDIVAGRSSEPLNISAVEMGRIIDRIPFRHPRFPAWFPGPGGATHPRAAQKGLEQLIRKIRNQGINFPWKAVLRKRQSPAQLEAQLIAGHPTLIYGVGQTGIPHVVVPIERIPQGWLMLDPGYLQQRNPMHWSDQKLRNWWRPYFIFYPRGTMVSLQPDGSGLNNHGV
jgi:hypothetical protein